MRRAANERVRKARRAAIRAFGEVRRVRAAIEGGRVDEFAKHSEQLVALSKAEGLTIHKQSPPHTVNVLDVVLAEGIAHA